MKTPAFLSKPPDLIIRPLVLLGKIVAKTWFAVFGRVSWSPPHWFSQSRTAWMRFSEANPRITAAGLIAIFLVSCGASWTWNWYQNRPKPHRVSVSTVAIPVTKLEKELKYPPLIVRFSDPAARLEDLKKLSLQGVRLEPQIGGAWSWNSDKELVFRPTEDWPADQKYRIVFDKKFFAPQILMERLTYETQTPPFAIAISQLELYQDPANPKLRQVTATLELTHAVEPGDLDRHIQLLMVGGSAVFPPSDPPPHFAMTYGLHRRLAYLRSSPVTLPENEDFMKLELNKGVRTTQGGAQTHDASEQKVKIPSIATAFQINSIEGNIARNKNGEPEQVVILSTTADIGTRELAKAVKVWLLPKRKPETKEESETAEAESAEQTDSSAESKESSASDESEDTTEESKDENSKWQSATDVPDDVLEQAKPVEFTPIPSEKAQDRQHAFRVRVETDGELYIRVAKGVRAFGQSQGGLLALSGERKLSIRSRGLSAIEYEIARVATTQINHLVSQTGGKFEDPEFHEPSLFNKENISRIAVQHQPIALENKWKANYSAFDFSEQLRKPSDGGSERGLFFLIARGWDPAKNKPITSIKDSRFLLVTDVGILTKKNTDGGSDVFLVSVKTGKPISGATVEILGKNGVPIQTSNTAADGHCTFPSVEKSEREKSPVAFVARNGDDIAFMPFAREDRVLNFSRFETDGAQNIGPEGLDAFVFTERGVYRPGDEIHIGFVVKQRNWRGNLKGLPLGKRLCRTELSNRERIADRRLHDQRLSR